LLLDTKRFRNNVQIMVNNQVKIGGVQVLECPRVPGVSDGDDPNGLLASYYNYPVLPFPVAIYDLGQVRVRGTYNQIMANVRSWAAMKRFHAVAHGLAISGTAPKLEATYNIQLVTYIQFDGTHPAMPVNGVSLPGTPAAGAPGLQAPTGGTSTPPAGGGGAQNPQAGLRAPQGGN
jgi:hypothetical protein